MFLVEYTNLDKVVSRAGFTKLLNIVEDDKALDGITRKPSFSIKQVKRGGAHYIHFYANERRVAYLKVDEGVKEKIRRKVAEYLVYPEEVEKMVEKLYREILTETSKDLETL